MKNDEDEDKSTRWMIDDTPIDRTEYINSRTKEEIKYKYLTTMIKAVEKICKRKEAEETNKRPSKNVKKIDYSTLTLDEFEPLIQSDYFMNQPKEELLAFYKAWLKKLDFETPTDKLAWIVENGDWS